MDREPTVVDHVVTERDGGKVLADRDRESGNRSFGIVESRMAELDDIQRSMAEDEEAFVERKYTPRKSSFEDGQDKLRDNVQYSSSVRIPKRESSPTPEHSSRYLTPSPAVDRISTHEWTFEEQFKQLYELGDEPDRKTFLDDLFAFMQKRGTPVNRVPIMAKQTLDLYKLFRLVVDKGGLVEVINKKIWREIIKGLNLPASVTSAAFTLRTQYMKYLYPYECSKRKLSTPSELQAAIDGNRRDSRRTYGSFGSPGNHDSYSRTSPPSSYSTNHSPGLSHRSSPGTSPTGEEVHVPPTVHGNNGVAVLHSPGLSHRTTPELTGNKRAASPEMTSRISSNDRSPSGSPVKKFAGSNDRDGRPHHHVPWTHIKIQTPPKGFTLSSQGQYQEPGSPRPRDNNKQLPLTLLDQVSDNSLLVSVELNGIAYQGVLFARQPGRPHSPVDQ
ncbi:AT-rich interactive domain-containing protein 3C isoform X2 [Nematostella vectensis]|uniref:AT-rich interactive domain-containing protein 3C isoform X2 n=1 Tax=Nematostella vectensis TaxID=45351 RepID=UPI0020770B05|nr:AT-rich interactive domain-containing protein 3C isoform X2 [Nematostella vectensis]